MIVVSFIVFHIKRKNNNILDMYFNMNPVPDGKTSERNLTKTWFEIDTMCVGIGIEQNLPRDLVSVSTLSNI